uniref:Putative secreted peptide n=1 Tax=Anopheles braziliensis TaxID=58242 RepID=A0A2M3ZWP0_9DIPT
MSNYTIIVSLFLAITFWAVSFHFCCFSCARVRTSHVPMLWPHLSLHNRSRISSRKPVSASTPLKLS